MSHDSQKSAEVEAEKMSSHSVPLVHRSKDIANTSSGDTRALSNGVNGAEGGFASHTGISLSGFKQEALLLHKAGEHYKLESGREIPEPKSDSELLIQVLAVGESS